MTHTIQHLYQFSSGVKAEVVQSVRRLRGASSEEPEDFFVTKTELWVNDHPANALKHWAIVDYVVERGQPK